MIRTGKPRRSAGRPVTWVLGAGAGLPCSFKLLKILRMTPAFVHGIAPLVVIGVSAVLGVFAWAAGRSCHQANPIMALRTE